jgi:hypothetical protein
VTYGGGILGAGQGHTHHEGSVCVWVGEKALQMLRMNVTDMGGTNIDVVLSFFLSKSFDCEQAAVT